MYNKNMRNQRRSYGTYSAYSSSARRTPTRRTGGGRKRWLIVLLVFVVVVLGFFAYKNFLAPTTPEQAADRLQFDSSVAVSEQQAIQEAIVSQAKTYRGSVSAHIETSLSLQADSPLVLAAYVPVSNVYTVRQSISKQELASQTVLLPAGTDPIIVGALSEALGVEQTRFKEFTGDAASIAEEAVAFIPADQLSPQVKLLALDGAYYLDSFVSGAVFRLVVFSGGTTGGLDGLTLNSNATKDTTLKVNMTGVTALTRQMMKKLSSVGSATFFSEKIGPFLRDADITHVSNEVSFRTDCAYSTTKFCSPPAMLEALKDSGVDVVELTGNHNNDVGSQYNTESINLYHSLGWGTFGGGLNSTEAAKPFIADQKGTKVAFLGYNYADAPGSGAIATASAAGANGYNPDKVRADIASAKQQGAFVIVDVQFWECYAYPDGYVEFPECDLPIGQQTSVFRQIASMGADMVVGSSAHQPQTYEIYQDTPIYYGLGNLYFEQTNWPGTERGIILTHYFAGGKLLQTKLTPTVYDKNYQTRVMDAGDAQFLLDRLNSARSRAGL